MQAHFWSSSSFFILSHQLGYGNCGDLGRGKICRESTRDVRFKNKRVRGVGKGKCPNRKKVRYLLVSAMFASVDNKCRIGLWKTEQEINWNISSSMVFEAIRKWSYKSKEKKKNAQNKPTPNTSHRLTSSTCYVLFYQSNYDRFDLSEEINKQEKLNSMAIIYPLRRSKPEQYFWQALSVHVCITFCRHVQFFRHLQFFRHIQFFNNETKATCCLPF